jgi:hypothetical protein
LKQRSLNLNPMSQQLILELSDEVYADLQQKANAVGLSITDWVVAVLNQQGRALNETLLSEAKESEARQKFRSHAGAISLGYATGTDNEGIEADLVKAYVEEYREHR